MGANRVDYRKYVKDFISEFRTQDQELAAAFRRRDELTDLVERIAELRYQAIAVWLDGEQMFLPWGLLTDGQRKGYIEAELQAIRGF